MALMEFAHSLGYPHYELMLEQMSATQFIELQTFFRLKAQRKQDADDALEEARIMHHLSIIQARQQGLKNGR